MTADALYNAAVNDKASYDAVIYAIRHLRSTIDRVAATVARDNAAWHDDPDAADHAAFHAPADEQFPRKVRDEAVRDLVAHYLGEFALAD